MKGEVPRDGELLRTGAVLNIGHANETSFPKLGGSSIGWLSVWVAIQISEMTVPLRRMANSSTQLGLGKSYHGSILNGQVINL